MTIPDKPGANNALNIAKIAKSLAVIIPLAVAANFIYALLASKGQFFRNLGEFNFWYALLALAITFIPWLAHSTRIFLWGKSLGKKLSPAQAFRAVLANDVGGAVVPIAAGGGYAKLGFLVSYGFSAGEATLVALMGTLEDALFFILALPLAISFSKSWNNVYLVQLSSQINSTWPIFIALLAISIGLYFLAKWLKNLYLTNNAQNVDKKSVKLLTAISQYKKDIKAAFLFMIKSKKRIFGANVLFSGAGWIARYSIVTLLITGFGYKIDPILAFVLQWLVFSAASLIPTPGGIVAIEFSFAIMFKSFVPSSVMPVLVGLWRFLTFYLIVIAGALGLAIAGTGHNESVQLQNGGAETKCI